MARGLRTTTEPDTDGGRHPTWSFVGALDGAGKPLEFFTGIPARDLTAMDVAALDDAQYATVVASPLYREASAPVVHASGGGDGANQSDPSSDA